MRVLLVEKPLSEGCGEPDFSKQSNHILSFPRNFAIRKEIIEI
jgi:hypothetical protein